jgi:hypothetical protein
MRVLLKNKRRTINDCYIPSHQTDKKHIGFVLEVHHSGGSALVDLNKLIQQSITKTVVFHATEQLEKMKQKVRGKDEDEEIFAMKITLKNPPENIKVIKGSKAMSESIQIDASEEPFQSVDFSLHYTKKCDFVPEGWKQYSILPILRFNVYTLDEDDNEQHSVYDFASISRDKSKTVTAFNKSLENLFPGVPQEQIKDRLRDIPTDDTRSSRTLLKAIKWREDLERELDSFDAQQEEIEQPLKRQKPSSGEYYGGVGMIESECSGQGEAPWSEHSHWLLTNNAFGEFLTTQSDYN